MSRKLIALTGVHRIVRPSFMANTNDFDRVLYQTSISDGLRDRDREGHLAACPFFDDLVMYKEIARDIETLPALEQAHDVAICEQWHVGNVAWAKARLSPTAGEYERKLPQLLKRLEGINLVVWHVSTDPDKIVSSTYRAAYLEYLDYLANLIKVFDLAVETLDDEALPDMLQRRITYLLKSGSDRA